MKTEVISIKKLLNIIQNQEEKLQDQQQRINFLEKEVKYFKEKLDYLIRQKYTPKSEKFNNQPSLFEEFEDDPS